MKKKLAAVLAGVMVLTFGMATVFAGSPVLTSEGEKLVSTYVSDLDVEGTVSAVTADTVTASYDDTDEVYYLYVSDTVAAELTDGQTYYIVVNGEVVEATYDEASGAFVVSADAVDLDDETDYDVEIYEVAEEDDTTDEGDDTEEDTDTEDSTGTNGTSDGSNTSGSSTSDKTGAAATLPIIAVAALAGVVVCGKKVKFYE